MGVPLESLRFRVLGPQMFQIHLLRGNTNGELRPVICAPMAGIWGTTVQELARFMLVHMANAKNRPKTGGKSKGLFGT